MSDAKVAFVTGAASGFGKALSTRLVEKGWKVALLDINEAAGAELEKSLGPSSKFFQTDVSSYSSQSTAFLSAYKHFGNRLDALVANAGIVDRFTFYQFSHHPASVDELPPAPATTATDIDWKGVLYGIYLATHFIRFNDKQVTAGYTPKIVATASCAGVVPHPALPEYSGAKSAVVGLVRATSGMLKDREGIALSAVCPGLSPTAILPSIVTDPLGDKLLTPVGEVVRVFEKYLDEEGDQFAGHVGLVMEDLEGLVNVGGNKFGDIGDGEAAGEHARRVYEAAMDPMFVPLHGEKSGVDFSGWF